ncbi:MAG TPA: hypothetical protein VMQ76_09825 [Terracidiphilus sp.]|jgi:hypothetical protein|nr:hypothetical protein [Terracidiphilus sp.]
MSPLVKPNAVFVNIPYDERFRLLYLAYIVGLTHLGLEPRATLGISGTERRLDRILALIQSCRYSIHDLSRVQLDRTPPCTPRFNMPFELGLTVTWAKLNPAQHSWFVFEARPRRVQKSLSDLDGSDPNIHDGTVEGVMREICNAFVRSRAARPAVPEMMRTYRGLSSKLNEIIAAAGARSVFEARIFDDLCFAAKAAISHT